MKQYLLVVIVVSGFLAITIPTESFSHQDGCHRWHSCPSDSGSYTCGDTGYCSECPDNNYCKAGKPYTSYTPPNYELPETEESPSSEGIPPWVKNVAGWWAEGITSKTDFVNTIRYLIDNDIIHVENTVVSSSTSQEIPQWVKSNAEWWSQGMLEDADFILGIEWMIENGVMSVYGKDDSSSCKGDKMCIEDIVQRVIDGDTLIIGKYTVRLSLIDTPENDEDGFKEATAFTSKMCPLGKTVLLDQDDLQPTDRYDRIVGKVTCSGVGLNEELLRNGHAEILTQYCQKSEFRSESWAKEFGC